MTRGEYNDTAFDAAIEQPWTLPLGWRWERLGDLGAWFGGGTPSKSDPSYWSDGSIPWVSPKDMKVFRLSDSEDHITEAALRDSAARLVPPGSVVCVMRSGILRHTFPIAVTTRAVTLNQDLRAVHPREGVLADFIAHFLRRSERAILAQCSKDGTTVNSIDTKRFLDCLVPLPDLATQSRTVARIDELFAEIEEGERAMADGRTSVEIYRKALLKAAVTGELTADWRREKRICEAWHCAKLGDLIEGIEAGLNVKAEGRPPQNGETGIVKVSAVTWDEFNEDASKTLPPSARYKTRDLIQEGDFLISRANTLELVGAPAIVKKITRRLVLSDKVLRLRMRRELKSWVYLYLKSVIGRREIETRSTGNQLSMRNISQNNLCDIPIPVPTDSEMEEICLMVARGLGMRGVDMSGMKEVSSSLRQSILAAAFRGELAA